MQRMALEYFLIMGDTLAAAQGREDRGHALRLALASTKPSLFATLFPEFIPPKEDVVKQDDDLSDMSGTWKFTQNVSPTDVEQIMAMMGGSGSSAPMSEEWT